VGEEYKNEEVYVTDHALRITDHASPITHHEPHTHTNRRYPAMFKEIAPYVITATVIICALINRNKNQEGSYFYHRRHIRGRRICAGTVHNVFEPDIQQQLPDFFGSSISYRLLAISTL
jgi:hypothetical protein